MNVILGRRFSVWDENADPPHIAEAANALLAEGIGGDKSLGLNNLFRVAFPVDLGPRAVANPTIFTHEGEGRAAK